MPDDAYPVAQALAPVLAPNSGKPPGETNVRDGLRASLAGVLAGFPIAAVGASVGPYAAVLVGEALHQMSLRLPELAAHESRFWVAFLAATVGYASGIWAKMWREGHMKGLPEPDHPPP